MIICTFDDRASDIIGLKLLIASLHAHAPGTPVFLACPVADAEFETWLKDYPHVQFDRAERWAGKGWDVKPLLLKHLLQRGHDEVMWMDSDIIVTRPFLHKLPADGSMVVTDEPNLSDYGVRQRVAGWRLQVGRNAPPINSCVVRVRAEHMPLLDAWLDLMAHPDYQAGRSLPFERRMPHVLGDQDVLVALLASTRFGGVKLHYMRSGRDILQFRYPASYSLAMRLRDLVRGLPALVHAQGHKPWRPPALPGFGGRMIRLGLETSPYSYVARRYRAPIAAFPQTLEVRSTAARVSRLLSIGQPALCGLALSVWAGCGERAGRLAEIARRGSKRVSTAFASKSAIARAQSSPRAGVR